LARELSGGGHRNAAAAVIKGTTLEGAIDKVLTLTAKYVR
jgi:nanoRNase/pAp phosphatase (c-di-AMP/oligoRNAs hydrolase)